MRTTPRIAALIRTSVALAAVLTVAPLSRALGAEVITATAQLKTAGGAEASAPVTISLDRFSTDAERDEVMAALKKGGTDAVQKLLASRTKIGSVKVGARETPVHYAYARPTGSDRLVTVVTSTPIAYVGGGAPNAAPKTGERLGLLLLELSAGKPGTGEFAPAAKVRLNESGAIVTEDYSREMVKLSNVVKK